MQVGDKVAGRYRLVHAIGRGGMGLVYEAYDEALDRSVAVKVLHPPVSDEDFTARFSREAAVLARLRSPHILTIFDHGTYDDRMFLVTELVPDGDLQTWVREHGPLPSLTAVRLCEQLCDALSDAHHSGVVHRDVKPANVLLWNRRDGLWTYLADFGIAREGSEGLTRTGAVVGSVAYMAPERHVGQEADERSDLYSVGCVLWALLEGRAPYSGTDFQVMNAHLHEPIPELSESVVGRDLILPVLERFLAKRPEDRMASADQARSELSALAARLGIMAGAADAPVPAPPALDDEPHDTILRPHSGELAQLPPPASPPPKAPDGLASPTTLTPHDAEREASAASRPRRRAGLVLAAVAAAVVVVLIAVVGALALGGDDEPDPPRASDPSAPATTPASNETEPAAPPRPPAVKHSPAYRAVRFAVEPAAGSVAEVRRAGSWTELADETFAEPAAMGGDRVCLTFRSASTSTSDVSEPREVCDRAAPPKLEWVRTKLSCQTPTGQPCAYYNLDVAGFRPGARLPVSFSTLSGEVLCAAECLRPVPIGKDGRGKVDGSLRKDGRPAAFVVAFADGTPVTFVIRVGDQSIRERQPTR